VFSPTALERAEFAAAALVWLLTVRALVGLQVLETRHSAAWHRQLSRPAVASRFRTFLLPPATPLRLSAALKLLLCACAGTATYAAFLRAAVAGGWLMMVRQTAASGKAWPSCLARNQR